MTGSATLARVYTLYNSVYEDASLHTDADLWVTQQTRKGQ